jgi:D-glycero-D-manno-heptose 1,7-bisphosphate phosphatase
MIGQSSAREDATGPALPMALLDRDGVINRDVGYPHRPDQIVWIDGIFDALARLREQGYRVVVVTNQSGIARGMFTCSDVERLHTWMAEEIVARGGRIDAFFYCPYHPDAPLDAWRQDHEDRKPKPGMVLKALKSFPTQIASSFMIGDKPSDMAAASAADIRGFLFAGGRIDRFVDSILASLGQ